MSAALELLHIFALIHDDVMDESTSRRGQPSTAHLHAAELHRHSAARGAPERFGDNIAILLGDLAHAEADALVAGLPAELRRIWRLLVIELVYGPAPRPDRQRRRPARPGPRPGGGPDEVRRVHRGAAAPAGCGGGRAPDVVSAAARRATGARSARPSRCGTTCSASGAIPARTGKPAGDDLISASRPSSWRWPTSGCDGAGPATAGPGRARRSSARRDITQLQDALQACGVVDEVEARISGHVADALAALDSSALTPTASAS